MQSNVISGHLGRSGEPRKAKASATKREREALSYDWSWELAFAPWLLCSGLLAMAFWHDVRVGILATLGVLLGVWLRTRRVPELHAEERSYQSRDPKLLAADREP